MNKKVTSYQKLKKLNSELMRDIEILVCERESDDGIRLEFMYETFFRTVRNVFFGGGEKRGDGIYGLMKKDKNICKRK